MKRKNKILTLGLALTMISTVFTGCGDNTSKSSGGDSSVAMSTESGKASEMATENQKPDEGVKLSIAVLRSAADVSEKFADKYWVKKAEEGTGIQVDWVEMVSGQHSEKLSLIMAGDFPDAFLFEIGDVTIIENPSLFVPLNDLLEKYAPGVYKTYEEEVPGWRDYLTYPDGNIYGLMTSAMVNEQLLTGSLQYINTQWIENLKLKVPTTMEELYDVLVAFRDNDANGDGDPNNEIPLDFTMNDIFLFASSWGLPINASVYYTVENDEVKGAIDTPEFRSFLEYMNKLAKEKLLNLEGFSQKGEQFKANLDGLKVGLFYGWAPYTYINSDAKYQYDSLIPMGANGIKPKIVPSNSNLSNRNGFTIPSASKNVEAALRWFDYISQKDFARTVFRGPKGLTWDENANGDMVARVPTADELKKAGYPELAGNTNDTTLGNTIGYHNYHPFLKKGLCADTSDPKANITIRVKAMEKATPYLGTPMPARIAPSDAQEEFSFATEGLYDYIRKFVAESIMNGVTDASWETYLKELDNNGYKTYLKYYNNMYKGTF